MRRRVLAGRMGDRLTIREKAMKILIIGPAHPLRGGIAQFLALLYNALKKRGHDVLFHRFIRQYPKFLFPGKTQDDESKSPVEVDSKPLFDPLNPFNWFVEGARIAGEKPNLIILKWWMPFFGPSYFAVLLITKLLCRTKVLLIVDNAIPHEKRPGDMLFTKLVFSLTDYFVVMSESVRDDLIKLKPDAKFILTPHPLYDVFGEPKDKDEAKRALGVSGPVILFFGFIREYKGLHVLLDAMPKTVKDVPLTLVVAGEFYEDKDSYTEQIDRLQLKGSVKVLDRFIPNEAVGDYFSAADVLVLPYRSATQSGITQIAFAFDLPVIATHVGGLPEVVTDGETGFLVPPDDPEALADAVIRYFQTDCLKKFSENVRRERGRFSWEAFTEAVERISK
jgi:D-inositol-3-phosphate glycosyltransferase